ncbi:Utp21 protein [Rhizoctonia solani]|uniref:Utp21 protein n=1 Tax=Rhizoctonia solani TaxID=456999 RepID=A0A8H7LQ22_9AGAM|nr:Utp21 protein [Rhizoctonia solani]
MAAATEAVTQPPRKKSRKGQKNNATPVRRPTLFAPFRALGIITNHVPFAMQARSYKGDSEGPKLVILTCLGKAWALWEGGRMGLILVSPDAPSNITAVALDENFVWALAGTYAIKYTRGKEIGRATNPLGTTLSSMLLFGSHLLCLSSDGAHAIVWDKNTFELQGKLSFTNGFTAAHMLHPATYLNKVLFASSDGSMQLWNIRTATCLHTFLATSLSTMTNGSPITALCQSPAVDVIGIGFASGECVLYDIRSDEKVMRVFMEGASVRAIAFRTGLFLIMSTARDILTFHTDGHPTLATASATGHIAIWDLNAQGRLMQIVKGAHNSSISAVQWIPGQPVMVTSGDDNSLKQWLFESPDEPPRLLKYRAGHHAPPHLIRYYGEDGKQILTASRDRSLRYTSVVRDSRSFELSQGSLEQKATSLAIPVSHLKLPAITAVAYSSTRSKDWEDVLTAHTGETFARTWSVREKKLGKWSMGGAEKAKGVSTKGKGVDVSLGAIKVEQAVCVSACGNFGFIGTTQGVVQAYNMQSGLKRRTYTIGKGQTVTGIASDTLNKVLVASTLTGSIHFFDFHTTVKLDQVELPSTAVSIELQRDSGLLAVVCDDLIVRILDIETRKVVRELKGFGARVLDVSFSYDSRWLSVTSLDSTIRTFDIPTGRLIDAFKTPSVATSITWSPTGDFLASAHVDSVGVFLWTNKAQYSDVSLQTVTEDEFATLELPTMQGEDESEGMKQGCIQCAALTPTMLDLDLGELAELSLADTSKRSPGRTEQLEGELVTLTVLPRSKWQTLLNLEVIQARNKPTEAPRAPEKAPFFLPTVAGVDHKFDTSVEQTKKSKEESRRKQSGTVRIQTEFQRQMSKEEREGDYSALFALAQSMSPAALDLEIRSLSAIDDMELFMHALTQRLKSHRDFEAVETYLAVFLRIHSDILTEHDELRSAMEALDRVHKQESQRILELVDAGLETGRGLYFTTTGTSTACNMFASPPQDPPFLSNYVYDHHSDVHVIKSCQHERGRGLLAVAGESRVEVLLRDSSQKFLSLTPIASFHVGATAIALDWSPEAVSPTSSDNWNIELGVACADGNMRILRKTPQSPPTGEIRVFGGGTTGHSARISSLAFSSAREGMHVASVGEDCNLLIWNLSKRIKTEEESDSSMDLGDNKQDVDQAPSAYPIAFSHPLQDVIAHDANARVLLVADSRGTVSLVDWAGAEADEDIPDGWSRQRVVELMDPRRVAEGITGVRTSGVPMNSSLGGGADWKPDDPNIIGATYGSRWMIWDLRRVQGGKPVAAGEGFLSGGHRFRWCPTDENLFAVSTTSPVPGAAIKVYHISFPGAPRTYQLFGRPHRVRDVDWLTELPTSSNAQAEELQTRVPSPPWLAVAVGRKVYAHYVIHADHGPVHLTTTMSSATKAEPPGKAKSKPSRTKQSASSNAPKLKVVIRRLPPNLPENIFWQSVAQWVTDESSSWKLYVPGKLRTKLNRENTPSRAYVEFVTPEAVVAFSRDYNGHVFRDKQGNESAAVVEYAPYQKVPHEKRKADAKIGTIETDEDFISFLEALNKPAEPTPDVNELVTQGTTVIAEPTSTPLLDALKAAKEANTIKGYHSHYRDQPTQPRHRVQDLEDAETFSRKVPLKNQQDLAQSDTRDVEKSKEKEKEKEGGGKRGKNKQKEKAPGTGPGPKSPKPAAAQSTAPSRGESSRARPPAGAGINARVLAALGGGAPPGRKGGKQREPSASGAPASESTPAPVSASTSAPTPSAAPPTSAASLPAGVIAIPGAIKSPETPKKSRGGRGRGRGGGGTSGKDGGSGGLAPTTLSDMPRIDDPSQALPPVASTQRGRGGGGGSGRGRGGRGRGRGRGGSGGGGESAPSATQGQ